MATQKASFIDLHAEKLAIGLAILLLGGAVYYSLGGGRFSVNEKTPAELVNAVGDAAENTRRAVQNAQPKAPAPVNPQAAGGDPVVQLQQWFGDDAKGLIGIAQVDAQLPRAQPFPAAPIPLLGGTGTKRNLAQFVRPDIPVVSVGRSALEIPVEKPTLEEYTGRDAGGAKIKATRAWVSVAAQVDLVRQEANFITEQYPEGSYLTIVNVRLQRKDETDPRLGWEEVDCYLPFKSLERPQVITHASGNLKIAGLDAFRQLIDGAQDYIARPKLPGEGVQLPPVPYLDEPPQRNQPAEDAQAAASRRAKAWTDLARKALSGGKRPFTEADIDAAYLLARAAAGTIGAGDRESQAAKQVFGDVIRKLPKSRKNNISQNPPAPERLMPIVAHDLDVLPGHTYVYRIGYEAFNIYVGNSGELSDPADALRLTAFSGWSPPSRPIQVTSDTYFYLTKAEKKKNSVGVTVYKVTRRGTIRNDYTITVGKEIGRKEPLGNKGDFRTGTRCVDIDFDRMIDGKKEVSLIYIDLSDGVLREKILSRDQKDPFRKELTEQRTATRP